MTRTQYITLLDELHLAAKRVAKLRNAEIQANGKPVLSPIEEDRQKKTDKIIDDLVDRLYEDGAICRRVAQENAEAGITEQDEFEFSEGR